VPDWSVTSGRAEPEQEAFPCLLFAALIEMKLQRTFPEDRDMGALNLKNFPEELHRQAKSRAALEGITLRELVMRAVTRYLAGPIILDVKEVIVKEKGSEPR